MSISLGSYAPDIAEFVLDIAILALVFARRQAQRYRYLCMAVAVRMLYAPILLGLIVLAGRNIERHLAYRLYFYIYYVGFALESLLGLLLIYSIFNVAMAPFDGLKRLGSLVFRWAACISLAIALAADLAPQVAGRTFLIGFVTELQRTQCLLTLGLLLFVCFAIRPMGFTYRSRVFGISLGLGIQAVAILVASAGVGNQHTVLAAFNTWATAGTCAAMLLWIGYFAVPEHARRIVVLPTTSPFLRWNQIAQALGDQTGYVAIAGIPPELFAPAELEVMRRASAKIAVPHLQQPQRA